MDGESFGLVLLAGSKWTACAGMIGLTGAVAIRRVLPHPFAGADPLAAGTERRLAVFAGCSAAVLLVGTAARLYAQTWSVFGLDEPVTPDLLRVVGVDSRWGGRWRLQAGFAALALLAAVVWRRRPRAGWRIAALAAAGAWVTLPLTGHAVSFESRLPWAAQVAHGAGAGVWIGTLAALAAVVSGLARRPEGHGRAAVLVDRFSPLAVAAVGTVALSGILTAALYLGTFADPWATGYGRVLLAKVVLFLATGAVGAYNWRRLTPRLGNPAGTRALLRSVRLELALAAGVLLATAVLAHLAMPREME